MIRIRRFAGIAVVALAAAVPAIVPAAPARAQAAQPVLATPAQLEAEQALIALLADPEVKAAQARVKAALAQTEIGKTADGAARIEEVVAQWTNSLTFKELLVDRPQPVVLWGTDDTPRTWLGHTLGGVGTSGDNPDHIYRSSAVDGSGRYELVGKFDPARRPVQFVVASSALIPEDQIKSLNANSAGLGGKTTVLSDRDLKVGADGTFRIAIGGPAPTDGTPYIALDPGTIGVGFRDVLSDWDRQQPASLTIRRLDSQATKPLDRGDLKRRVIERLGSYVRFWSAFPNSWFGGLQPNTISKAVPREGGWGYLAGLRFSLKPDEAILVTTTRGGAQYQGIQVTDPWMIAADGRRHLTSLNPTQVKADADGTFSFVIAARDPGVANWLDTAGLHDGYAVLRWQNFAAASTGEGLLRDFKVIKLADAAKVPGIATITPEERRAQVAGHAASYTKRAR
ncbi:MAG TPA: hypothetical protein VF481_04090 [Novosphingobium sp.]